MHSCVTAQQCYQAMDPACFYLGEHWLSLGSGQTWAKKRCLELETASEGPQKRVWAYGHVGRGSVRSLQQSASVQGSWAYLHEHCLQLLTGGLFSGSSGSKRCTAGRQAASTSPSLSPPLDKAQKHSEHHRRSEALLPQLPPAQLLTAKPTTLGKHGAAPGNPHRGLKSPRCPGNSSRGQQR